MNSGASINPLTMRLTGDSNLRSQRASKNTTHAVMSAFHKGWLSAITFKGVKGEIYFGVF